MLMLWMKLQTTRYSPTWNHIAENKPLTQSARHNKPKSFERGPRHSSLKMKASSLGSSSPFLIRPSCQERITVNCVHVLQIERDSISVWESSRSNGIGFRVPQCQTSTISLYPLLYHRSSLLCRGIPHMVRFALVFTNQEARRTVWPRTLVS